MLAEDVGRRAHLEVVELVDVRHQVGERVLDALAGVGAEEERLRRALAGQRVLDVAPQRSMRCCGKCQPSLLNTASSWMSAAL